MLVLLLGCYAAIYHQTLLLTSIAALFFSFFFSFFGTTKRIDAGDSCITTTIEWDVHNEAHGSCVAT